MFCLALVSGLRKGELSALLWDDLNIENKNPNGELTLSPPSWFILLWVSVWAKQKSQN